MSDFLPQLESQILVCDGGFGTQLRKRVPLHIDCLDACNVEESYQELVRQIHLEYCQSGADIIQTNTYGANQRKLELYGFGDRVEEINQAGVELAKHAVAKSKMLGLRHDSREIFVAGSVGPLESNPFERDLSVSEMEQIFKTQIAALVVAGVDLVILETFTNLHQATVAVKLALEFEVPVIAQISGVSKGLLRDGTDVRVFAQSLAQLGVSIIGLNCRGPHDLLSATEKLAPVISTPLSVQPNAGTPRIDQGQLNTTYSVSADLFNEYVQKFIDLGVNVIGGCCGTTPEYIRKIRSSVAGQPPIQRPTQIFVFPEQPKLPKGIVPPNPIQQIFEHKNRIVSVEMRANTFPQLKAMLNAAQRLATVGVDMFDVPDNAGATVNIGTIGTAFRLQQVTNIPTLIHWTTRQRNLISIQSHLLEAWALGIQGVIALSGDHPKVGRYETAKVVTDLRGSVQLMALLERLNQGHLIDGSPLGEACNFYVGGGLTIAPNLIPHLKHLRQKVENGARFVYTQPVYTLDDAEQICHATRNFGIKVLLGILPITSFRSISFLRDNLGMYIPLTVVDRFQSLSSSADQATYGLEMINDFVHQLGRQNRFTVDGIYVIPPARINWKRKQAIISQLIRTFRSQV